MAEKARIAILISGRGSNMGALIYAAKSDDCPYEVVLVASNDPGAAGLHLADAEDIPTFAKPHKGLSREEHDQIMHEAAINARADYIVLAGYMRILSDSFVEKWAERMFNIHPSLLPKYKGLNTYQRAIDAGDSHAGCSVHLVTPELDDGPVLAQTEVAILPDDTAEHLAERILIAEHQLYPSSLSRYVTREADPEWILEQVRQRALALEETHERASFGSPGWRVGSEKTGKYFAYFTQRLHGEASIGLLVKTTGLDEQSALLEADPELYYLPKFYGKSGWIAVRLDTGRTDWEHIADRLAKSWRMVAPKKLVKFQEIADEF